MVVVERHVPFRGQPSSRRKLFLKKPERSTGRATKAIDCLIRISHREKYFAFAGQLSEDLDLSKIDVLEFVGEDEPGTPAFAIKKFRIPLQHRMGVSNHVAERAEVILAQHALDRGKHAGNFLQRPMTSSSDKSSASFDLLTRGTLTSPRSS